MMIVVVNERMAAVMTAAAGGKERRAGGKSRLETTATTTTLTTGRVGGDGGDVLWGAVVRGGREEGEGVYRCGRCACLNVREHAGQTERRVRESWGHSRRWRGS